ncbi:hypothetical protein NX722_10085 [Endozoicomonas gorgoniicola]|uniref:DUF6900 domain-containing protein n=1 Tax=Endozoicomonas gorgoniicola TaxID=1234144 RepID=A0ABT3MR25_9GAMM|nr:hypothetical protein [Endozoicomonas gorgoniicola]MCW7551802.1 hypothetical protein [Endozoicomonas gorgoniicola]MCW7552982.1 hypothetical protein [Endozoicomonas gorgoniicola]
MNKHIEKSLEAIARKHLFLDTLKTRNSSEDFEEQSIWSIKKALEAAYQQGFKDGQQQ